MKPRQTPDIRETLLTYTQIVLSQSYSGSDLQLHDGSDLSFTVKHSVIVIIHSCTIIRVIFQSNNG